MKYTILVATLALLTFSTAKAAEVDDGGTGNVLYVDGEVLDGDGAVQMETQSNVLNCDDIFKPFPFPNSECYCPLPVIGYPPLICD